MTQRYAKSSTTAPRAARPCSQRSATSSRSKQTLSLLDRLGDELLQKETLALPDLVEVLGQRPYPLKATLLEYLQELQERKVEETAAETPSTDA